MRPIPRAICDEVISAFKQTLKEKPMTSIFDVIQMIALAAHGRSRHADNHQGQARLAIARRRKANKAARAARRINR